MNSFTKEKITALCERGLVLQRKANYGIFSLSQAKDEQAKEDAGQKALSALFELKGIFTLISKAVENDK